MDNQENLFQIQEGEGLTMKNILRGTIVKVAFALTIVGIVAYCFILYKFYTATDKKTEDYGNYGDLEAGFVGTLFTLCSVIAFYAALKDQQNALSLQMKELQATNQEMRQSRWEFKSQKFENTFFNLLQNHLITTNELALRNPLANKPEDRGRGAFRFIWGEVVGQCGKSNKAQSLVRIYNEGQYGFDVLHYFNNLYRLLEYVSEFGEAYNERSGLFAEIIKDQLSPFELRMILLHLKAGHFPREMDRLEENYNLFERLKKEKNKESYVKTLLKYRRVNAV